MIRKILILSLVLEICFLFFMVGRTYEIKESIAKSNKCLIQTISQEDINKYFNHNVEMSGLYPHAEAFIIMKYHYCLGKE